MELKEILHKSLPKRWFSSGFTAF